MRPIVRNIFVTALLVALPGFARAATTFAESGITLQTPTGNISGTLAMPVAKGPVPVVLIIAGSGSTDRDGNSPAMPGRGDTYKLLASSLAARGIASVRYDKRGLAASAPAGMAEKDLRFDTFVDDAASWVAKLAQDPRFSRVVVAGHSEGSLIGMIAAQRGNVAAYVSLEGAGRPIYTVLDEQFHRLFPAALPQADAVIAELRAGHQYTGALPPELQSVFRSSIQPYMISWFKYDPAVEIGKLHIPVTIVQGTADVQVSMADAQALKAGDPSAQLVVVQGMNHALKHAPDVSSQAAVIAGYTDPNLAVVPEVINAVAKAASP